MANKTPSATLNLDLNRLNTTDPALPGNSQDDNKDCDKLTPPKELAPQDEPSIPSAIKVEKDKPKPYVNTDRVNTGGAQRDKLSEEELTQRMERMKQQNEKIKQRRMDVQADKDAFEKTQEAERIRLAQSRQVQEHVNRTREQNARRKMEKVQLREWDSGKSTSEWKQAKKLIPPVAGGITRGATHPIASGGKGKGKGKGTESIPDTPLISAKPDVA